LYERPEEGFVLSLVIRQGPTKRNSVKQEAFVSSPVEEHCQVVALFFGDTGNEVDEVGG
jgi:hypothetical protein